MKLLESTDAQVWFVEILSICFAMRRDKQSNEIDFSGKAPFLFIELARQCTSRQILQYSWLGIHINKIYRDYNSQIFSK